MPINKKVLNVGGGSKDYGISPEFNDWEHLLLDIDPKGNPDIVCDARELHRLPAKQFDAVYCSHNLEHYYKHDIPKVLSGFRHVLKDNGVCEIRVPDMGEVFRQITDSQLDIEDVLYQSGVGPIKVSDVIYGYAIEIETSGNDYYAHKTGFTVKSLVQVMHTNGFPYVFHGTGDLEIRAISFMSDPDEESKSLFGLS